MKNPQIGTKSVAISSGAVEQVWPPIPVGVSLFKRFFCKPVFRFQFFPNHHPATKCIMNFEGKHLYLVTFEFILHFYQIVKFSITNLAQRFIYSPVSHIKIVRADSTAPVISVIANGSKGLHRWLCFRLSKLLTWQTYDLPDPGVPKTRTARKWLIIMTQLLRTLF